MKKAKFKIAFYGISKGNCSQRAARAQGVGLIYMLGHVKLEFQISARKHKYL